MNNLNNNVLKAVQRVWGVQRAEQKNLNQQKAAKAMGMGQSALSQYLRGEIPLNPQFLSKFSQLTKTPLSEFGYEGDVPSQDLRTITLPVKYTLSGKIVEGEKVVVQSLVPHDNCYLVRVDYRDHVFSKGTLLVVDPSAQIVENDVVMHVRPDSPIILGSIVREDDWEIHEPHWFGGRVYIVDTKDVVNKCISVLYPEHKGAVFKK